MLARLAGTLLLSTLWAPPAHAATVEEGGILPLPATRVERLIINHPQGALTLRGGARDNIVISFHKQAPSEELLAMLRVQVDIQDGVVRLRSGVEVRGDLLGLPQPDASIDLVIDAPRGAPLVASTFNGPLTVSGFHNDVDVGSQTGAIRISNVTGAVRTHSGRGDQWLRAISGSVDAHGLMGDLRFASVAGASLTANVVNGQIAAQDIRAQLLRLHAAVGAIYLFGPLFAEGHYEMQVDDGDIQVQLPAAAAFQLEALGPQIQVNYPLRATSTLPNSLRGAVGSGGPPLRLSSLRGHVTVQPLPATR